MPIINFEPTAILGDRQELLPLAPEPTFGETFQAAVDTSSIIGSFFSSSDMRKALNNAAENPQENYDPLDNIQGYEDYATRFTRAYTPESVSAIKKQIDKEIVNRQVLHDAGALGTTLDMAAAMFDPVTLAVGFATGGAGWVARGTTFLSRASRAGLITGAAEIPQELAFQQTQVTRTGMESMMNIAGVTILGGIIGGGLSYKQKLPNQEINKMVDDSQTQVINRAIYPDSVGGEEVASLSNQVLMDAGAAGRRVGLETNYDLEIAGRTGKILAEANKRRQGKLGKTGELLSKGFTLSTPIVRTMTSPYNKIRNAAVNLFDNAFVLNKNYGGDFRKATVRGLQGVNLKAVLKQLSSNVDGVTESTLTKEVKDLTETYISKNNMSPSEAGKAAFEKVIKGLDLEESKKANAIINFDKEYNKVFDEGSIATQHSAEGLAEFKSARATTDVINNINDTMSKVNKLRKEQGLPILRDDEVSNEIGKAIIYGDSGEPFIDEAAEKVRKLLREISEEAKRQGVLPEDLELTENYLPRLWSVVAMNEHPEMILKVLSDHIENGSVKASMGARAKAKNLKPKVEELDELIDEDIIAATVFHPETGAIPKVVQQTIEDALVKYDIPRKAKDFLPDNPTAKQWKDFYNNNLKLLNSYAAKVQKEYDNAVLNSKPFSPEESKAIAREAIFTIKGNAGYLDNNKFRGALDRSAGFSKERTINIDNIDLVDLTTPDGQQVNFISTNIEHVITRYTREMFADIEVSKKLQEMNPEWTSVNDLKKAFDEDVKELIDKSPAKDSDKILKEAERDWENMQAMLDRMKGGRGGFGDPSGLAANTSKSILTLNTVTMLGSSPVSAIADVGKLFMRNGFGNTILGAKRFFGNKFATGNILTKSTKNMEHMEVANIGLEVARSTRSSALADVASAETAQNTYQMKLEKFTNNFFKYTGMNAWNDAVKTIGAFSTQHEILKVAKLVSEGKSVPRDRLAKIAQLGLGKKELLEVAEQFKKHGEMEGRVNLANATQWDNPEIRDIFSNALYKDSKITVVTPSVGDKPLWFDANPVLRHVTQFQGFGMAANNRSLIAGLQGEGNRFAQGVVATLTLSYASLYIRDFLMNGNTDRVDGMDNTTLIGEVVDRSGLINVIPYIRKLTVLFGKDFFASEVSRYQQQMGLPALGGPTVGIVQTGVNTVGHVIDGEPDKAVSDARRLIPYQNLWYLRGLITQVEEEIEESLD